MRLDDEAVSAGEKLQHEPWDKIEKVTPDGWCTDLEPALDGKWSVIYNEDSSMVAMKRRWRFCVLVLLASLLQLSLNTAPLLPSSYQMNSLSPISG